MSETQRISYFSVEQISPAHPDSVMDSVAEALVDAYLEQDINSRIAVDGAVKGKMFLCGEITSNAEVDKLGVVKSVLKDLGYVKRADSEVSARFNCEDIELEEQFTQQSADIAMGVDRYDSLKDKTAGDQGMAISGAIAESPNLISHSQELAKILNKKFFELAVSGELSWARTDIKTQVTTKYIDNKAVSIDTVVISISHAEEKDLEELREEVKAIATDIVNAYAEEVGLEVEENLKWFINATGKFSIYGPHSDSGEVGRKIVCNQLGGLVAVGGGNLNGKDPTKVDRTGVYGARYAAKNVVAAGLAHKCEINLAYCIGVKEPVSITVNTFGTNTVPEQEIEDAVKSIFDFTPGGMINQFKLISTQAERGWTYKELGMFGHLGNPILPWEQLDKVEALKEYFACESCRI